MSTPVKPFRQLTTRYAAALLLCMLGMSSAQALTFCVNSVPLLKVALFQTQFLTGEAVNIRIVQGTYLMDASINYALAPPTTIEGGYTAGCAARVVNPANTVINIGAGHSLDLRQASASPQALLVVDGLTFSNSNSTLFFGAGALGDFSNDEGTFRLSRTRFTQLSGGVGGISPVTVQVFDGLIDLENVQFDHINSAISCAVMLYSQGGAAIRVNHMTADLANGDDFCMDDDSDSAHPHMAVFNSILWSSAGGLTVFRASSSSGTHLDLLSNIFKGQQSTGTPFIENSITVAPGWINPAVGNYHLQTAPLSPAVNSGTSVVTFGGEPATDIEGNPRVVGSAPDRGAYESSFNDQTVLIVTNTLDSGAGSLREAMIEANSSPSVAKSIQFDIRGAGQAPICPAVIALNTILPAVISTMKIDGYTQPQSTKNTSASDFNANLCIFIKPASGTLAAGFRAATDAGSNATLTLRGLGIGGFGQPLQLLGGHGHIIAGNQFGGVANGVALPGAGLSTINIGVNAAGSLIIGGPTVADRNVIGGAATSGIDIQSTVHSSSDKCQIVNNLIGLTPNGTAALPNSYGINVSGSGCAIARNQVAGNSLANILINGDSNIVQQNQIGITSQGIGLLNNAIGIQVSGANNVIGAGGNGGSITANTVRFMVAGGVVIDGDAAIGNSVNANLIYQNGSGGSGMDIDLKSTGMAAGLTANDIGDVDSGANEQQNAPVPTLLVYTAAGSINRPAMLSGKLDSAAGAYRFDVYYSSSVGGGGRGHAEVFLTRGTVNVTGVAGGTAFSVPILVPNQSAAGVLSFTATDSAGNTSELSGALSIVSNAVADSIFAGGFE